MQLNASSHEYFTYRHTTYRTEYLSSSNIVYFIPHSIPSHFRFVWDILLNAIVSTSGYSTKCIHNTLKLRFWLLISLHWHWHWRNKRRHKKKHPNAETLFFDSGFCRFRSKPGKTPKKNVKKEEKRSLFMINGQW